MVCQQTLRKLTVFTALYSTGNDFSITTFNDFVKLNLPEILNFKYMLRPFVYGVVSFFEL